MRLGQEDSERKGDAGRDNALHVGSLVLWRPLSDGDTPEQALTNAQNAIASWIEAAIDMNRPIPDPSPQQSTADRPVSWSVPALLIYCRDHRCSHHVEVSADGWADDVRLSDIEPGLPCVQTLTT